jgi:hypothetical protein
VATDFRVLGGVSVDKATAGSQTLFPLRKTHNATPPVYRFIRRNNENQFLIYTEFAGALCPWGLASREESLCGHRFQSSGWGFCRQSTQATHHRRFSHSAKLTTPRHLCIGSFVATMKTNSNEPIHRWRGVVSFAEWEKRLWCVAWV